MPSRNFAHNRRDHLRVGYVFKKLTTCGGCKAQVEAWTTPKGKSVLFNMTKSQAESEPLICHFDTCPKRKRRDEPANPNEARRRNAVQCRQATNALAVVVVYGDGEWAADVDPSLSAEDAKHEIITTANLLKRAMEAR